MIFQITCNVVAEGYIEPEVAAVLAPELRPLLMKSENAHSWRWLFALQADDADKALEFFRSTWKAKIGELGVYFSDEEISER